MVRYRINRGSSIGATSGARELNKGQFNIPTPERVVHNSTPCKNISAISTQRFRLPTAFHIERHQQYIIEYIQVLCSVQGQVVYAALYRIGLRAKPGQLL